MSGSSRLLQRALAIVFSAWDNTQNWENEPSAQIKSLYDTIYAYTERHNTWNTHSNTVNDELRATHEEYVKNSGDVTKEVFFLELLTRLLAMLSRKQVELWLYTYLRPAVDSAGFDLRYIEKARKFVASLTLEVYLTSDNVLLEQRYDIANMVMEHILRIFIGGPEETAYTAIGLEVSDAEKDTQIHVERVRFIEKNAASILREWGLKHPLAFFTLLHKFYLSPAKRFKVLDVAAKVVSNNVSLVQKITETPFFLDVLKSLLLDASETIMGSCLSILLMVLGKICHKTAAYLPELFVIFTRLLVWKDWGAEMLVTKAHGFEWAFADSDQNTSIMKMQIYSDGEFNLLYYTTLMYALFPMNLIAFCKAPHLYLQKSPPRYLEMESLRARDAIASHKSLQKAISSASAPLLRRLMVHPNIIEGLSPLNELQNPIKWILEKNEGTDVGEEEVLLECYGLNPDILFTIPESVVVPETTLRKILSAISISQDLPDFRLFQMSSSKKHPNPTSHRGSIQSANEAYDLNRTPADPQISDHWFNAERRVSIIPTKLMLDTHSATQSPIQVSSGEIKFKKFNFDGSSTENSELTLTLREDKSAVKVKNDQLADLYAAHEKLYTSSPATSAPAQQITVNMDTAHSTAQKYQSSGNTASDILSKQLKSEGKSEAVVELNKQSAGSALDFYQRELLLMKNELEFSSYMKHLNKTNYIKLKLRFNKTAKEYGQLKAENKKTGSRSSVAENPEALVASIRELQISTGSASEKLVKENEKLYENVKSLNNQIDALRVELSNTQLDYSLAKNSMVSLKKDLREKEEAIRELNRNKEEKQKKARETPIEDPKEVQERQTFKSSAFLTDEEAFRVNLKTELAKLTKVNSQLEKQLEEARSELETQRKNVANDVFIQTERLKELHHEQIMQFERKLKELNAVQVQYEQVVADQGAKIAQLTKSQTTRVSTSSVSRSMLSSGNPLAVDVTMSKQSPENMGLGHFREPFTRSTSPSSGSLSPSVLADAGRGGTYQKSSKADEISRTSSSTTIPIIKGRGGYQKRSKKLM